MQTRCTSLKNNADVFRPAIERFLDDVMLTNSVLIYAPSQIALAAIIHAAGESRLKVSPYQVLQTFSLL